MERVLLLSLGFGTGHNAAAKALEAQFSQQPETMTDTIDLLQLIPKTFHPLLQSGYQGMLVKFPSLYHLLYDWTYQFRLVRYVSKELVEKIGLTIRSKILSRLQQFQPTKIVTTHPFSLLLLPTEWEQVPTIGVVTDYELHPMWLVEVPDVLCVPKKMLKQNIIDRLRWRSGVKVLETGLPIEPKYYEGTCRLEARSCLSLPSNDPVVLVMGGGLGLGPLEQVVDELESLPDMQFVILTGSNQSLFDRLEKKGYPSHIRLEKYRSDMDLFMTAADLLITKPGGVTITEALAKQLPMLLFEAFPGQEEANQQYLVHHRVAFKTKPETVCLQINKFFQSRMYQQKMEQRFHPLVSPDAAERIVQATLEVGRSKLLV
ncbi:MGDG synthase family glycosyltransferase [Shimazuella kribbensis]|uniref:MGDG synthase family glycosyltransferase n=1 Tax=Shimazuella kribbensis TaxID=139808 RepID=UPI000415ADAF|nr:glycosyltransferase [Shimazuella kribbensis]